MQHGAIDAILASRLWSDGLLPWSLTARGSFSDPFKVAAALTDPAQRKPVLAAVVDALLPRRRQLVQALESPIRETLNAPCFGTSAEQEPSFQGAHVVQRARSGRTLVAARRLELGTVILQERPLESTRVCPVLQSDQELRLGPGGLAPETALALRLWRADALARPRVRGVARELMDHGGRDHALRRERAVVAVMCALASGQEWDAEEALAGAEALFLWLGRVRINAVAVTALAEQHGMVEFAKNALALYPGLAAAVNHDCRPNALLRFSEDQELELIISAPHGVEIDEDVTISYGPMATVLPCLDRRSILLGQYGFECACVECCRVEPEDFSWRTRAQRFDARACEEAQRENWRAAAVASSASLAALNEGYMQGDIELAREECKVAGILLRAGDTALAREHWARAADSLRPLVSDTDPDCREALDMLAQLPKTSEPAKKEGSRAEAHRGAHAPPFEQQSDCPCDLIVKSQRKDSAKIAKVAKFSIASSHVEFSNALTQMCAAMVSAKRVPLEVLRGSESPARPVCQTTSVADHFAGAVLGTERWKNAESNKPGQTRRALGRPSTH